MRCRLNNEGATMMIHSRREMLQARPEMIHDHQTAPTQFVEANGIRFAYRRFGKSGGVPLVLNQHFTGTMDHWDPAVTNGFAKDREVILFNNAGVSAVQGKCQLPSRVWPQTPSPSSERWGFRRSTCWVSPLVASSLRRSPAMRPALFAS